MSDTSGAVTDGPTLEDLQTAAAERDSERAGREAAERKLAIVTAGVDISTPAGQFFAENYKGELDPEVVKAQAIAVGAAKAPEPPAPEPPADNSQANERLGLGAGDAAGVGTLADEHPVDAGFQAFNAALASGSSRQRAAAHVFDRIIDAAAKGDQRVIHNEAAWREEAARA